MGQTPREVSGESARERIQLFAIQTHMICALQHAAKDTLTLIYLAREDQDLRQPECAVKLSADVEVTVTCGTQPPSITTNAPPQRCRSRPWRRKSCQAPRHPLEP